jgi:hypothetical protein
MRIFASSPFAAIISLLNKFETIGNWTDAKKETTPSIYISIVSFFKFKAINNFTRERFRFFRNS